jgi:hypothetical protein
MLLYFRLQNDGWPLQGTVFVGKAEDEVLEAVELPVAVPFNEVDVLALPTSKVAVGLEVVPLPDLVELAVAVPFMLAKMLERSDTVA